MLNWFLDGKLVDELLHSDCKPLAEEHQVEVRPERVPMKCLDDNVSLNNIRSYFTIDALKAVENVLSILRARGMWYCFSCSNNLDAAESLCCDSCLDWHHLNCVGPKQPPKKRVWFCRNCHQAKK